MSVFQRRIEVRPYMVAWAESVLCGLMGMLVLSGDEPIGCVVGFTFAGLFGVAAWFRCGNLIPIFGLGLFFGMLFQPAVGHGDPWEDWYSLIAGGIMGLAIGAFADFVVAEASPNHGGTDDVAPPP